MLKKNYKDGEQLDVAGLNKIIVLIDRSESELSEIGLNEWRPNLDGPPHKHGNKDQVFYITSGVGKVKLGNLEYDVTQGCCIYVPAGLVHQTITTGDDPLCYMLFNIFNSPDSKEGHGTFAEHIEKVKQIRKQQADSGNSDIDDNETNVIDIRSPKFFKTVYEGKEYDFGSNFTILLLDREETNGFEFMTVTWPSNNKGTMVAHSEKEQTFFVLKGTGAITIGDETEKVKAGDVIFVPRNSAHTTESFDEDLIYLCLNCHVGVTKDSSFDEMYKRVAPGRIKRWENGAVEVGE
jgi:mannose-6-phosphate isomerase-like protein (cupin superfamily)